MNTISKLIPEVLNALCSERVYQSDTPDQGLPRDSNGVIMPFVLWDLVGGQDQEYLDKTMPDHRHCRVQIHAVAASVLDAEDLSSRARDALLASSYTVGVLGSPIGTLDETRELKGRKQQFSIWFQQT